MKIRELRASDAPRVLEFLTNYFPEEEALMGTRPEGFAKVVRRIFRLDSRLLLGFLRLVGRSIFNFYVIEEEGRIVATTLLTYPGPTGFISMVVVDPTCRRRGFAKALLEHARATSKRRGKSFVALDVLAKNAPAIALYERLGYRRLRTTSFEVHDAACHFADAPEPPSPMLRSFRKEDAAALVEIVRARNPPEVERVLPLQNDDIGGSRLAARTLQSEYAAWVIDRGHGAEAWIGASVSPAMDAAHVAAPIVGPTVEPSLAISLVRTAGTWCSARRSGRIMASATEENVGGRAALEGGGFHEALSAYTLYRPVE